jgi:hypothetical protein
MSGEPKSPVTFERPQSEDRFGAYYSEPTSSYGVSGSALWLAKRTVHAILCIAIPICIWAFVIRWSSQKVIEQLPKSDPKYEMMQNVKKFEIKEFDLEGFHQSLGMPMGKE